MLLLSARRPRIAGAAPQIPETSVHDVKDSFGRMSASSPRTQPGKLRLTKTQSRRPVSLFLWDYLSLVMMSMDEEAAF
jgi:hypothetical protein